MQIFTISILFKKKKKNRLEKCLPHYSNSSSSVASTAPSWRSSQGTKPSLRGANTLTATLEPVESKPVSQFRLILFSKKKQKKQIMVPKDK